MISNAAQHPVNQGSGTNPWLVKISPMTSSNCLIELVGDEILLGAADECEISLLEDNVSGQHATLTRDGDLFRLVDCGSERGTFANQSRILEHRLCDGDRVRVGDAVFKFLGPQSAELHYHQSVQSRIIRDGLTDAYNKRFMLDFLERELDRCINHKRPLSVLMMDIDFFKQTNDTHGHVAGDEVLQEFAQRISPLLDSDDIFARYGGEEFSVVMCENDLRDALELAEQIRAIIGDTPFKTPQGLLPITVSIGISWIDGRSNAATPTDLVRAADEMLYEAKSTGRNRVISLADALCENALATTA